MGSNGRRRLEMFGAIECRRADPGTRGVQAPLRAPRPRGGRLRPAAGRSARTCGTPHSRGRGRSRRARRWSGADGGALGGPHGRPHHLDRRQRQNRDRRARPGRQHRQDHGPQGPGRYDELGRRTFAGFGTTGSPGSETDDSTIDYAYDDGDRLVELDDSQAGVIENEFDGLGRLISQTTPGGEVEYGCDDAGRRETLALDSSTLAAYGYDDAGRLTSVAQGGQLVEIGHDTTGRPDTLELPGGIVRTTTYDLRRRRPPRRPRRHNCQMGPQRQPDRGQHPRLHLGQPQPAHRDQRRRRHDRHLHLRPARPPRQLGHRQRPARIRVRRLEHPQGGARIPHLYEAVAPVGQMRQGPAPAIGPLATRA
jgi:YD repeat-containing protein